MPKMPAKFIKHAELPFITHKPSRRDALASTWSLKFLNISVSSQAVIQVIVDYRLSPA
jgi:hypothetical protein